MSSRLRKGMIVTGMGDHFNNAHKKAYELFNLEHVDINHASVSPAFEVVLGNQFFSVFDSNDQCDSISGKIISNFDQLLRYLKSVPKEESSYCEWSLFEYSEEGSNIIKS